jgi:hypothetical protein
LNGGSLTMTGVEVRNNQVSVARFSHLQASHCLQGRGIWVPNAGVSSLQVPMLFDQQNLAPHSLPCSSPRSKFFRTALPV